MNEAPASPSVPGGKPEEPSLPSSHRPLRIWPPFVLIGLMLLARYIPPHLEGGLSTYWMFSVFGPLLGGLLILIWWVTLSRATRREKVIGFFGVIASLAATLALVHPTMRGPGTTYFTLPMGMVAFALGAALFRARRPAVRTTAALVFAIVAFDCSLLVRSDGMTGDYVLSMAWRWSPTAESALLAASPRPAPAGSPRTPAAVPGSMSAAAEWPGFRGPDRASRSRGPRIATNWSTQPPRLLWKIPVGPAWSSFAVSGDRLFTQEQRGPMETVVCYDTQTGLEKWRQQSEARFDEPLGGPGPRATPTLAEDGLFVTGATGLLLRLNPATGEVVWQQDLTKIAGRDAPMWGFAASPVITSGVAVVHAGGPGDKGLLGFDATTGALRWSVPAGNDSYSSPQLSPIAGENLILQLSNDGLLLVDPATGRQRLNHAWKFMNYRALQPQVAGDNIVLLPTGMNVGTRALRITRTNEQLNAEELWTSRHLKPDFTDLVIHKGYIYGNDSGIFTCVDLKTGERRWKGGRYGKGQVLLLENSDLLLVAAEQGQVVILKADPGEHAELGSFQAIAGKTWNHPVVVGDRLYVRNAQEAACYVLPLAEPATTAAATSP